MASAARTSTEAASAARDAVAGLGFQSIKPNATAATY
jgi:hypothetical protein